MLVNKLHFYVFIPVAALMLFSSGCIAIPCGSNWTRVKTEKKIMEKSRKKRKSEIVLSSHYNGKIRLSTEAEYSQQAFDRNETLYKCKYERKLVVGILPGFGAADTYGQRPRPRTRRKQMNAAEVVFVNIILFGVPTAVGFMVEMVDTVFIVPFKGWSYNNNNKSIFYIQLVGFARTWKNSDRKRTEIEDGELYTRNIREAVPEVPIKVYYGDYLLFEKSSDKKGKLELDSRYWPVKSSKPLDIKFTAKLSGDSFVPVQTTLLPSETGSGFDLTNLYLWESDSEFQHIILDGKVHDFTGTSSEKVPEVDITVGQPKVINERKDEYEIEFTLKNRTAEAQNRLLFRVSSASPGLNLNKIFPLGKLAPADEKKGTVRFRISDDLETGTYPVEFSLKSLGGRELNLYKSFAVKATPRPGGKISSFQLAVSHDDPSLYIGKLKVGNTGSAKYKNLVLNLKVSGCPISSKISFDEIPEGTEAEKEFSFRIPRSLKTGSYKVKVSGTDENRWSLSPYIASTKLSAIPRPRGKISLVSLEQSDDRMDFTITLKIENEGNAPFRQLSAMPCAENGTLNEALKRCFEKGFQCGDISSGTSVEKKFSFKVPYKLRTGNYPVRIRFRDENDWPVPEFDVEARIKEHRRPDFKIGYYLKGNKDSASCDLTVFAKNTGEASSGWLEFTTKIVPRASSKSFRLYSGSKHKKTIDKGVQVGNFEKIKTTVRGKGGFSVYVEIVDKRYEHSFSEQFEIPSLALARGYFHVCPLKEDAVYSVNVIEANLYKYPDPSAKILDIKGRGIKLKALSRLPEWVAVENERGRLWIRTDCVSKYE